MLDWLLVGLYQRILIFIIMVPLLGWVYEFFYISRFKGGTLSGLICVWLLIVSAVNYSFSQGFSVHLLISWAIGWTFNGPDLFILMLAGL